MAELSIDDLEDALKLTREQKDSSGELKILRELGSALQKNRQFTKAASCLLRALSRVEEQGSAEDRVLAHARLGSVYWEMAQLKKAMTHLESALKIQNQLTDASDQAGLLILMGISHWRKCKWEEGLNYFRQAQNHRLKRTPETASRKAKGEYSFIEEALERAVGTLENRIRLGREQGDPLKILQPLFAMIPLYLFTEKTNEIDPLLQEAISLAKRLQKKDIQEVIPRLQELIAMR